MVDVYTSEVHSESGFMVDNVKKIYINPQWQGGADISTYVGAEEIKEYLAGQSCMIIAMDCWRIEAP